MGKSAASERVTGRLAVTDW